MATQDQLILYPNFGVYQTKISSKLTLLKEADLSSIKIEGNPSFTANTSDYLATVFTDKDEYFGRVLEEKKESILLEMASEESKEADEQRAPTRIYRPWRIDYSPIEITVALKNKLQEAVPISYIIRPASGKILYLLDLETRSLTQKLLSELPFDFEGPLKVMVGDIQVNSSYSMISSKKSMAKSQVHLEVNENSAFETAAVEEYKALKLGNKKIDQGLSVQTIQNFENLLITRYYRANLSSNSVKVCYSFVAPNFLAGGDCRVDRGDYILGESSIAEAQFGKEVKLTLGTTSRVLIKTTDISPQSGKMSSYGYSNEKDLAIESKIENLTGEAIQMRLEYSVGNAEVSKLASEIAPLREGDLLIFNLTVKPGKTPFKFSCHLKY